MKDSFHQTPSHSTDTSIQIKNKLKKALTLTKKPIFPFSLFTSPDYTSAADLYNEVGNIYASINNTLKAYKYYIKAGRCYLLDNEKGLSMHCLIRASECIYSVNKRQSALTYVKASDIGMEIGCYSISGSKYVEAGKIYFEIYNSSITGNYIEKDYTDSDSEYNNSGGVRYSNIEPNPGPNPNICINKDINNNIINTYNVFLIDSMLAYEKGVMAFTNANMKMNVQGVLNELVIILLKLKKYGKAGNIFIKMMCNERKYNNSYFMLCAILCYKVSKSGVYYEYEREDSSRGESEVISGVMDTKKSGTNKIRSDTSGMCDVLQLEEEELKVYESLGTESYEEVCGKYFRSRNVDKEISLLFEEAERISRPEHDIL